MTSTVIEHSPTSNKEMQQQHNTGTSTTGTADTSRAVLIAIDRSRHSERALRWYASKLRSSDDRVSFVNVTEPPELVMGFGMAGAAVAEIYAKAVDETVEAAKRLAINVKSICHSLGIEKIRFLERISHSPGQAIVEVADEEQADLIVLGSRGVGILRRTFLGSVSDYVLHHSRRAAVLIVPAATDAHQPNAAETAAAARGAAGRTSVVFISAGPTSTSDNVTGKDSTTAAAADSHDAGGAAADRVENNAAKSDDQHDGK